MGLLDHVAIAIDFSDPSKVALDACFVLAKLAHAKKLTIIHATPEVVLPAREQPQVEARLTKLSERIESSATKQVMAMSNELGTPEGVEIAYEIVSGTPARVIPETAERIGATLLAVGTHRRKGVRRWLKGSIAEMIVRGAKIPILVMPTGDDDIEPVDEIREMNHVLVAVDIHDQGERVVGTGLELVKALENKEPDVTLLSVDDVVGLFAGGEDPEGLKAVGEVRDALEDDAKARLEAYDKKFPDIDINVRVERGDADDKILAVATELGAHLIVVGSHGRNLAPLIELGSTTGQVLRGTNVSVLVVPSHPEH